MDNKCPWYGDTKKKCKRESVNDFDKARNWKTCENFGKFSVLMQ